MPNRSALQALVLLSMCWTTAQADGLIAPIVSKAEARRQITEVIYNGEIVDSGDPIAASTVAIVIKTYTATTLCSGVIVSVRHVLTAKHCADFAPVGDIAVFFTQRLTKDDMNLFNTGGGRNVASKVVITGEAEIAGADVAVLTLLSEIPASFKSVRIVKANESRVEVVIAGYGQTDPTTRVAGVLRKAEGIARPGGNNWSLWVLDDSLSGSCDRDSGGPMFLKNSHPLSLIGIVRNGDCKSHSYFSNLAPVAEWLSAILK